MMMMIPLKGVVAFDVNYFSTILSPPRSGLGTADHYFDDAIKLQ